VITTASDLQIIQPVRSSSPPPTVTTNTAPPPSFAPNGARMEGQNGCGGIGGMSINEPTGAGQIGCGGIGQGYGSGEPPTIATNTAPPSLFLPPSIPFSTFVSSPLEIALLLEEGDNRPDPDPLGPGLGAVRVKIERNSLQSGKNDHKKTTTPYSVKGCTGISVRQLLIPPNRNDIKTGI
jgi:hypothetical protein